MSAPHFDLARLRPYVPTALRIAVGVIFLGHAYAKAALYTFAGTEQFFVANGFPAWTVYPVFAIELAGGAAMILGLGTRWVSLALIPVMVGAIKPHVANGMGFSNPGGGWEFPVLLLVLLAVQAVLGSGAFALDGLLGRSATRAARASR
jgi:putative oxidoreductase